MARQGSYRAAALLGALCLSACNAGPELDDYEPRGVAEVREAQRLAEQKELPEVTREQALAEYRACTRKAARRETPAGRRVSGDPQAQCAHWMEKAYPAARNARNRSKREDDLQGHVSNARHAPVERLKPSDFTESLRSPR
jgi:hypothetical protein